MLPDNLFFTSDTHFGHKNIIEFCNRPFKTVEEMDEQLIENWNRIVPRNATVFHLGDLSFSRPDRTLAILERLHGTKYLIAGNHDKNNWLRDSNHGHFEYVRDYGTITVRAATHQQYIIMSHFPFRSWHGMHRGSWDLHGHCHGTLPGIGKQMDVGVDTRLANYAPISYWRIKDWMDEQVFKPVDHHGRDM